MHKTIKEQILESISVKELTLDNCLNDIESAAEIMIASIRGGGKILWCGNGGSAADAQHLATELMGGMTSHERKPIPSIALTTDSSFLTAWSNDTDFESVFWNASICSPNVGSASISSVISFSLGISDNLFNPKCSRKSLVV